MGGTCKICNKRILNFSSSLQCHTCHQKIHISCVPNLNINEASSLDNWICLFCIEDALPFNHITNDDEFVNAISENWNIYSKFSVKELEDRIFNPFEINDDNIALPTYDIDPDINYFNHVNSIYKYGNSDYFYEESFNNRCKQLFLDSQSFSLLHLNIRSMAKNINNLELYLQSLCLQFSIIGLTETWLRASNFATFNLHGYKHECLYRESKIGGGVSVFINNNLEYIKRSDISIFDENVESIFIELSKDYIGYKKNSTIGVIYRPPNTDMSIFNQQLLNILSSLKTENKIVYLMGDFNINLLNIDKHLPSSEFLENLFSYNFYPLINKPSRVSKSSATLIDNIFCNDIQIVEFMNGIFYADISDHFPIFTINVKSDKCLSDNITYLSMRQNSEKNIESFCVNIQNVDWNDILMCHDCQMAYTLFYNAFKKVYNDSFPFKQIKVNSYHHRKPWLSSALKQSIKHKNKLYIRSRTPTFVNIKQYKEYRHLLNKLLRKTKRNYYDFLLYQNNNNLRKSWSIIKSIINKGNNSALTTIYLQIKNR